MEEEYFASYPAMKRRSATQIVNELQNKFGVSDIKRVQACQPIVMAIQQPMQPELVSAVERPVITKPIIMPTSVPHNGTNLFESLSQKQLVTHRRVLFERMTTGKSGTPTTGNTDPFQSHTLPRRLFTPQTDYTMTMEDASGVREQRDPRFTATKTVKHPTAATDIAHRIAHFEKICAERRAVAAKAVQAAAAAVHGEKSIAEAGLYRWPSQRPQRGVVRSMTEPTPL